MDVTSKQSLNGYLIERGMRAFFERLLKKESKNIKKEETKSEDEQIEELEKIKKIQIKKYDLEQVRLSKSTLYTLKHKGKNSDKIIYQLHGGSYLTGLTKMYFKNAERYLKLYNDICVVSLDYRIAPKNLFPAALEDAIEGWNYLLSKGYKNEDIIIVGDSAGGNLALALLMVLRDKKEPLPAGVILMSPWADLTDSGPSRFYNFFKDPMFGFSKKYQKLRVPEKIYAKNEDFENKLVSPVYGNYDGFPPMLIQIGTHEILESDAIKIYEKALLKKVDVKLSRYKNMFHGFQFVGNILPEYKIAWHEVKDFIGQKLKLNERKI